MTDPLPPDLATALPGKFLAFEGPDGSGKSTQLSRFSAALEASGVDALIVREPGGTATGERIRQILLEHGEDDLTPVCEMMLYMASRAQLVADVIAPAVRAGQLVIADRFVASTIVYQGAAGGVARESIAACARIATSGLMPELTVIFDVETDVAETRVGGRDRPDRMEAKGRVYHERVRNGYLSLARDEPDRYAVIDGSLSEDDVYARLIEDLSAHILAGRPS